jgi:opacity protein-like surface antigen
MPRLASIATPLRLLSLLALACAAGSGKARAETPARSHLRLFGLVNHTNVVQSYRDLWSATWKEGIARDAIDSLGVGAGLEWPLGNRLSLGAEALLVRKGTAQVDAGGWLHLRYVEVPVLLRMNLAGANDRAAVYLLGGASLAFYVSGEQRSDGETSDVPDEAIGGNDTSLLVGAGLRLPLNGGWAAFAEVRLQQGLADIAQPGDVRYRTVGVSFLAGLRF